MWREQASTRFKTAFHTPQFWLAQAIGGGAVTAAASPFGAWTALLFFILALAAIAGIVAFSGVILGPGTSEKRASLVAGSVVILVAVAFGTGQAMRGDATAMNVAGGLCESLGRASYHGHLMLDRLNELENLEPREQPSRQESIWHEWRTWRYETSLAIGYQHEDWADEFYDSGGEGVFIPQMKPSVIQKQLKKLDELKSRAACW